MVESPSQDELRRYFEGEGQEVSCLLASRCALRVLAGLRYEWGTQFIPQQLQALRAILAAAGSGANPGRRGEWKSAAVRARDALYHAGFENPVVDIVFDAVAGAVHAAAGGKTSFHSAAAGAVKNSFHSGQVSDYSGFSPQDVTEDPISSDAVEAFSTDRRLKTFATPVWPNSDPPPPIARSHDLFLSAMGGRDGPWLWWRDWYLAMWNGEPMDWDFALAVAKLDWDAPKGESVWNRGPEAVTAAIEQLEWRYRDKLRLEVAELREELGKDAQNRLGIGGNNPPEAIDSLPEATRETLVIWEPLRALEAETKSNSPDKGLARKALDALILAAKACGILAAGTAVTTIASTATEAALDWLAGYGPQITRIIEAATTWLAGPS